MKMSPYRVTRIYPVGTKYLLTLALLMPVLASRAQTFYPNNATVNTAVSGQAQVGYANQADLDAATNGTSPTVSFVTGSSGSGITGYNSSTVLLNGGNFTGFLFGKDNSSTNVLAGSYHGLEADNNSTFNISGGTMSVSDSVFVENTAHLNLTGGTVGNVQADATSQVSISGGVLGNLYAQGSSNVILSGGTVSFDLHAYNSSSLTLIGSGLGDTFVSTNGLSNRYSLFGKLADGTDVTGKTLYVANGTGATVTFQTSVAAATPEPGTIALLTGIGATGWFLRKRYRRK